MPLDALSVATVIVFVALTGLLTFFAVVAFVVWRKPAPRPAVAKASPDPYDYVPVDANLAGHLDDAERFAKSADAELARLTGGDGCTDAYYATLAVMHVRGRLAMLAAEGRLR